MNLTDKGTSNEKDHTGILPRSLALDGKTIGDGKCGMIVTLCRHEDGRAVCASLLKKAATPLSAPRSIVVPEWVQGRAACAYRSDTAGQLTMFHQAVT